MSRDQSFKVSGINIVTHPHSPEGYVRLLKVAFQQRISVPVHGHQHLMIGSLKPVNRDDPLRGMQGHFYRFIQIDKRAPWFNVSRHDEATTEELSLINIPDDLRPNTETFEFLFYPKGHTLYFNRRSGTKVGGRRPLLGPSQVAKLLQMLFEIPSLLKEFGEVEMTVLPDTDQLEKILALPKLRRLVIEVTKPNADELGKAQARIFNRMDKMHARRIREEITAERHESVVLDEDTRLLANVAASNGKVEGHGYGLGDRAIAMSTHAKPWVDTVSYNPDLQTEYDALMAATVNLPGRSG